MDSFLLRYTSIIIANNTFKENVSLQPQKKKIQTILHDDISFKTQIPPNQEIHISTQY